MFLPFILSFIVAYLLNPCVKKLEKFLFSRSIAISAVLSLFIMTVSLLIFLAAPALYYESLNFINKMPYYIALLQKKINDHLPIFNDYISSEHLNSIGGDIYKNFLNIATNFIQTLWSSAITMINIIMIIVLTPVITFYLLKDWEKLVTVLDEMIPRKYYSKIKSPLQKINSNLSGYIRGQLIISLLVALFYTVSLTIARLEYSLFIGITAGILSFIPYVGTIFGFAASHLVAISQFGNMYRILLITSIFLIGQFLENFVLAPKLIGNKIDLHPVWIIFAIFAGGRFLGFTGILLAIPVATIFSVLVRFVIAIYKNSQYYESASVDSGK